jgi:hypothetical protein
MPKTYRQLWPQFCTFENLWYAYLAARRGKRARPAVAAYDLDAETRLLPVIMLPDTELQTDGSYGQAVLPGMDSAATGRQRPRKR